MFGRLVCFRRSPRRHTANFIYVFPAKNRFPEHVRVGPRYYENDVVEKTVLFRIFSLLSGSRVKSIIASLKRLFDFICCDDR